MYAADELKDSFEFSEDSIFNFLICLDFQHDEEPHWVIEKTNSNDVSSRQQFPNKGCVIFVWYSHKWINSISPICELWINDIRCETGIYRDLDLKWPKVVIVYKAYRFEFLFSSLENKTTPELPKPVRKMSADEWLDLFRRK